MENRLPFNRFLANQRATALRSLIRPERDNTFNCGFADTIRPDRCISESRVVQEAPICQNRA